MTEGREKGRPSTIVTRDPNDRIEDRAYFTTDPGMTVGDVLRGFARRWAQEVLHRDRSEEYVEQAQHERDPPGRHL